MRAIGAAAIGLLFAASIAPAQTQPATPGVTASQPHKPRPRVVVKKRARNDYGFLPGYRPPELRDRPARTYHYWYGRDWDGFPIGSWGTGGYGGMWYRGRFSNGFGPCYTRTPIGPMWNCG